LRVDPLWIVDLSDPSTPRIAGELHVPGWSTYIQPLGDRLVAIGINDTNDWRVAVSLFDVHDPEHPSLLSKVPLGVNNSWSEANNDEKAFGVFPEAGLILVPYQGYETNGYSSQVQLIDLGTDTLKARGTIDHAFQPRRAGWHNERVYSISGKELLAVDVTDRDRPLLKADVELSWSVDRVFVAGDYVLEVADGNSWYGWWSEGTATPPSIRVSKISDPDRPVSSLVLADSLPVIGATIQDSKLYLAQGLTGYGIPFLAADDSTQSTNPPTLFLSVVDLSGLPQMTVLGKTAVATEPLGWSPSLAPVWPKPGLLVWSGGSGGWWGPMVGDAAGGGVAGGASIAPGGMMWRPWWGGFGGRLLAFDVNVSTSPRFVSDLNLTTNTWWNFSPALTANGLVYLSHQSSEFVPDVTIPGQTPPVPSVTVDPKTGQLVTNAPPVGIWVQRYYLDVVDYADPAVPTVRNSVNIPGQLNGLSHGGAIIYTIGPHWVDWVTDWSEWLDASAYDGVSASLVASLPLPKDWPHPLLITEGGIFMSRPDSVASTSQLETWQLSDTGKFTQVGSLNLGSLTSTLALFDKLLVAQLNSNGAVLFDATAPASLVTIGKGQPQGCVGYDLSRAGGSLSGGLWVPLGDYGVFQIPPATATDAGR
jgi:hypothetical protein